MTPAGAVGAETLAGDREKGALGNAEKRRSAREPASRIHNTADGNLGCRKSSGGEEEKDERFSKAVVAHDQSYETACIYAMRKTGRELRISSNLFVIGFPCPAVAAAVRHRRH